LGRDRRSQDTDSPVRLHDTVLRLREAQRIMESHKETHDVLSERYYLVLSLVTRTVQELEGLIHEAFACSHQPRQ
jgi:hypothetical protein